MKRRRLLRLYSIPEKLNEESFFQCSNNESFCSHSWNGTTFFIMVPNGSKQTNAEGNKYLILYDFCLFKFDLVLKEIRNLIK